MTTTFALAGEIATKGIELAGAVRPIDNVKLWGNVALTHARYVQFRCSMGIWTGNTPSNVAPVIVNAGASYRFDHWRWPVEIGGSVRHVGNRYLFEDDATTMDAYTTADALRVCRHSRQRICGVRTSKPRAFRFAFAT